MRTLKDSKSFGAPFQSLPYIDRAFIGVDPGKNDQTIVWSNHLTPASDLTPGSIDDAHRQIKDSWDQFTKQFVTVQPMGPQPIFTESFRRMDEAGFIKRVPPPQSPCILGEHCQCPKCKWERRAAEIFNNILGTSDW